MHELTFFGWRHLSGDDLRRINDRKFQLIFMIYTAFIALHCRFNSIYIVFSKNYQYIPPSLHSENHICSDEIRFFFVFLFEKSSLILKSWILFPNLPIMLLLLCFVYFVIVYSHQNSANDQTFKKPLKVCYSLRNFYLFVNFFFVSLTARSARMQFCYYTLMLLN